jgi:hypothetical protein
LLAGLSLLALQGTVPALGCMMEIVEQDDAQTAAFIRIAEGAQGWDGMADPIPPRQSAGQHRRRRRERTRHLPLPRLEVGHRRQAGLGSGRRRLCLSPHP